MVAGHHARRHAVAMTATRHYYAPDGTFRKVLPPDRACREVAGLRAVAGLFPVPHLWRVHEVEDGCELVYEDLFASGCYRGLLADAINAADRQLSQAVRVQALVSAVCDNLLAATEATGAVRRLDECVPALYAARLAPGGRLDCWYRRSPRPTWAIDGQRLDLDDLAARSLVARGRLLGPGWPASFRAMRSALSANSRWTTAITQGDATEPNITEPLCWLDFEHAGRNALAGDIANLLWYLLGMGGWLVPTYQPAVYGRTLRTPVPPVATPTIEYLRITDGRVEIDYTWNVGAGRQAALATLLSRLTGDLGSALAPSGDADSTLRPFLVMRVLGVIPLGQMSGPHAVACLAKIAELACPALSLHDWCASVSAASVAGGGEADCRPRPPVPPWPKTRPFPMEGLL
jgi:hypothetical protein